MIYIYCDLERFESVQPDEYTWVVEQTSDYVPLRQKLRRALDDEDHDFTVYLRSPLLVEWLRDLRDYGERVVVWQTVDLHHQFLSRFGFPVPAELGSSAIQELGLLSLTPPGHATAIDPTGWLLGQHLGSVWEIVDPYPEHLADLAAWAANANKPHPALCKLAETRLRQWCQADNHYTYFLHNEWQLAGRSILLRWALRYYSSDLVEDLRLSEVPVVDAAKHALACVPLLKAHKTRLGRYWSLFFAEAASAFSETIEQALSQMSGLAQVELQALYIYASTHVPELSSFLVDRVRTHFHFVPDSEVALARLDHLVSPPLPAEPNDNWEASRWLRWATQEYLPYFAWIVRNKQPRQEQIRLATRFSDWLISHYTRLPFDPYSPLLINQHGYVRQFAKDEPKSALFWAIVDGLTWWQAKLLIAICQNHDLHIHRLEPALSALPSITSVSKRALGRGCLGVSEHQSIARVLEESLEKVHSHVEVFSELDELAATLEVNVRPGIYALLYNALDAHNHESRTFTDDESAIGYLRAIASTLSNAIDQTRRRGLEARILISSDHGSTLLPQDATVLKPPAFIQELDDEDEWVMTTASKQRDFRRTRACSVTRELDIEEVSLLKEQWYVLDKAEYGLADTLLIPKGYAYIKRRPRGWTHGGATPEETVVPFIELRPQPLDVWQPEVRFEGHLLPNRPSSITIKVINTNSFSLTNIRLSAWNGRLTLTLPVLAANEPVRLDVSAPAASERAQQIIFDWLLVCEVAGNSCEFSDKASLPVRRLQVSEIDELFEEMK